MVPSFKVNAVPQSSRLIKTAFCLLPIFIFACVFAGDKIEFWEKKDPSQWSQKECKKLLEDSPWVKHHSITSPWVETTQNSRTVTPPVVIYAVQLRSARPIAQAVERLNQITGQHPRAFGPGGRGFGGGPGFGQMDYPNSITVHIKCTSDNWMFDWSMFNYWTKQNVDGLKDLVALSGEKGTRVSLIRYVSPFFYGSPNGKSLNNEFDFIFPRQADGKEVLGADDEFLELAFPHPNVADNSQSGFRKGIYDPSRGRDDYLQGMRSFAKCSVKFKTEKMKFQGSLVY
jgi:hypothetical protein